MPVRKIPKNYRNVTGIAAYSKADGPAMYESTLERDFITLLEFDPAISSFEVQPWRIDWEDGTGKPRSYTPDMLVYYKASGCRPMLCEVKYADELRTNWKEFKPKFKAAVSFAKRQGWRFKLITEKHIRTPKLANAKFLVPFVRRGALANSDTEILLTWLNSLKQTTPDLLLAAISEDPWQRAALIPSLWYLIGTGKIATDLDSKLTMSSRIWSIADGQQ